MNALSTPQTRLWRYATRACAQLGRWGRWKVYDVKVKTVADLPPSEMVEISVASAPATLPLIVFPEAGVQNTTVPVANSACVMYCTITDAASCALSTTYARPPPPLPMVKV